MKFDYYLMQRPLNDDVYCGDAGVIIEFDSKVFLAVIDVLGHGKIADELADICTKYLKKNYRKTLVELLKGLHKHILGSRGVVASLCLLDVEKHILSYVSVGDTLVRKLNNDKSRIYSMPGIIGYEMRTIKENTIKLSDNDILLLHTDGVPSYMDMDDGEILDQDAKTIAGHIIARYGKKHDDALCIVLRYVK